MRKLTPPFIKFEDNSLQYAPSWKEYGIPSNFRPIYVGEAAGRSIFHKASPEFLKRKKETKISKPRAKSRVGPGFCDICTRDCQDLQLVRLFRFPFLLIFCGNIFIIFFNVPFEFLVCPFLIIEIIAL
ncbi:unnamed protein product [Onchocerca flexuosa]|uniref:Uncharacterized protein n=1 Tax=Onchocerca flexuosa TaxID=387005 RepID=A0A183HVV5_9BILA|nr:unnamed protein product [Onchocerca flexuosa]